MSLYRFLFRHLFLFILTAGMVSPHFLPGQAQETFTRYSMDDGLPSNHIYRIMQDSEGFLWVCTDAGVSRFNGLQFDNFSVADGLADNDILSAIEDGWGRIWFTSYNGRLSYYHKGMIYNRQNSPIFDGFSNSSPILNQFRSSSGEIWFGTPQNGAIRVMRDTIVQYNRGSGVEGLSSAFFLEPEPGRILIYSPTLPSASILAKGIETVPSEKYCGKLSYQARSGAVGGEVITACDNEIRVRNEKAFTRIIQLKKEVIITRLDWAGDGEIFINTKANGVIQINWDRKGARVSNQLLEGNNISSSFRDLSGTLWLTSLGNGLFRRNDLTLLYDLNEISGVGKARISNLAFFKGYYYCTAGKKVIAINPKDFARTIIDFPIGELLSDIKVVDGEMYISSARILWKLQDGRNPVRISQPQKQIAYIKDFFIDDSGNYYILYDKKFVKGRLDHSADEIVLKDFRGKFRPTQLHVKSVSNFLLGTNTGLFQSVQDTFARMNLLSNQADMQITAIEEDYGGRKVIGTHGLGIMILRNNRPGGSMSVNNGLISNFVRKIRVVGKGEMVVVQPQGISHILTGDGKRSIRNFTKTEGLIYAEIMDGLVRSDTLVVVGEQGIQIYRIPKQASKGKQPLIAISSFSINGEAVEVKANYELMYHQNSISIDTRSLNIESANNLEVEFRLDSEDKWTNLSSSKLDLVALNPGNYQISFRAFNNNSNQYSEPVSIRVAIAPPWWRTVWAWIAYTLLLALLVLIVTRFIIRARARRESLNRRITQSRLTALRTQMNPHFIFNSLNSIQVFVSQNEKKEAFLFLSRFGKLMRRILENSEEDFVTVEEEIGTLELYLQLEKLRSRNQFTFEFIVDDAVEPDYHAVPPTLIQPILENSIWHGVMPRPTPGHIVVRFTIDREMLLVSVEDNGVGREKSMESKKSTKKKHKSKALGITRERLGLLNESRDIEITLLIEDLHDADGKPAGTKVVLAIPISNRS